MPGVTIEGMRISVSVVVLLLTVLLTRALYWFMIMTAGLCLGPMSPNDSLWSEHVAASLNCVTHSWFHLPPPTVCIEHVTGKPAQYPQRMWKLRRSAVGCSQVCQWCRPAYLSFHVGIWSFFFRSRWQQSEGWFLCFCIGAYILRITTFSCH